MSIAPNTIKYATVTKEWWFIMEWPKSLSRILIKLSHTTQPSSSNAQLTNSPKWDLMSNVSAVAASKKLICKETIKILKNGFLQLKRKFLSPSKIASLLGNSSRTMIEISIKIDILQQKWKLISHRTIIISVILLVLVPQISTIRYIRQSIWCKSGKISQNLTFICLVVFSCTRRTISVLITRKDSSILDCQERSWNSIGAPRTTVTKTAKIPNVSN